MALREVVVLAFEKNLDIAVTFLNKTSAQEEVTGAKGVYDPTLQSRADYSVVDEQTSSIRTGEELRARNAIETSSNALSTRTELTQLIPSGATVGVGFSSTHTMIERTQLPDENYSPYARQRAFVSIRQPLMTNFGPRVTNAGIRIAEREREIAEARYHQEVLDQIAAVMSAYWDIVFTRESLTVQLASLESARELERINATRVNTGSAPRADLLQAQARVAERENAVIVARSAIIDAQDQLLVLLNWDPEGEQWTRPIAPTDSPDEYDLDAAFDDQLLVSEALQRRPDHRATELGVDVAQINRDVARWQRLPQLDLVGEYGFSGLGDDNGEAFDRVTENNYEDSMIGAEFRYPLLNRRAKANYRKSQVELDRSRVTVRQSEQEITRQLRAATRQIRTAQRRIVATTAQVAAAREAVTVERRRLDTGGSTTFNVLRLQEDLAAAEVARVDALVTYQKGQIELERSHGTLLDQLGRELDVEFHFEDQVAEAWWRKTQSER